MSLYRRFVAENLPSFITTNTRQRRPVFKSAEACSLLVRCIFDVRRETGLKLLAFAIMPDHVHLIVIATNGVGLGRAMQLIKGRFAREYNRLSEESGAVWQSRYHERTLRSEAALLKAVEYVHFTPSPPGLYRSRSAINGLRLAEAMQRIVTSTSVRLKPDPREGRGGRAASLAEREVRLWAIVRA